MIFCDAKHMPSSMLLNLNGHHTQQEQFSNQIKASEPLKKQLWQQIIKKKIKYQGEHLEKLNKPFEVLKFHESKVLSGDTDNGKALRPHITGNTFLISILKGSALANIQIPFSIMVI